MKLLYRSFFVALVLLLSLAGVAAAESRGFGARALGMGGAFTAVADDATAAYWNPAGLSQVRYVSVTPSLGLKGDPKEALDGLDLYDQSQLPALTTEDAALDGMVGLNLNGLGFNAMAYSDYQVVENAGVTVAAANGTLAAAMTLAREFTDVLALGTNVKYLHSEDLQLYNDTNDATVPERNYVEKAGADGLAFDVGALLKLGKTIRAGAVLRNLGPDLEFSGNRRNYVNREITAYEYSEELPTSLSLGVAVNPPLTGLLVAADVERNFASDENIYRIGVEQTIFNTVKLRAGVGKSSLDDELALSAGVGLQVGPVLMDVAVVGDNHNGVDMGYLSAGFQL
ncbi:MAG TPA: hypothetical protein GX391_06630 [Firmicutes bacterium]|nr:hypothetical protein [Bacillota bacterium]HOQ23490.1 hypothetical protein [Bacillota bacterium]HPT67985.1 hypothetical protein [Bacillota bacterium]